MHDADSSASEKGVTPICITDISKLCSHKLGVGDVRFNSTVESNVLNFAIDRVPHHTACKYVTAFKIVVRHGRIKTCFKISSRGIVGCDP